MDVIKIALVGIAGVLLAVFIKGVKPEFSVYISMGTCILILVMAAGKLEYLVETVSNMQNYVSIEASYIKILVKIIGITYIAEFSSSICKDAGFGTIASQIEVFSKLSILAISTPILTALLETIDGFL